MSFWEALATVASIIAGCVPYVLLYYLIRRLVRKRKGLRGKLNAATCGGEKKPARWQQVCAYLGGQFKEVRIGEQRAVYCYDYYPVGKFENHISEEDLMHRREILLFKAGDYTTMAHLLTAFLVGNFPCVALGEWILCGIPASTKEKHLLRYSKLLQVVSERTGIGNGMDCISILFDRNNSREAKEENTIRNLEFDAERVGGKSVLLIDDVTTRGTSFVQCAERLYGCGARFVCGFFMGKTVDV